MKHNHSLLLLLATFIATGCSADSDLSANERSVDAWPAPTVSPTVEPSAEPVVQSSTVVSQTSVVADTVVLVQSEPPPPAKRYEGKWSPEAIQKSEPTENKDLLIETGSDDVDDGNHTDDDDSSVLLDDLLTSSDLEAMSSMTTAMSPASTVTTAKSASKTKDNSDISAILAKAENHDGIVIDGLYLGMSIDDAKRVAAHALGAGFSTTDWNRNNWNENYWYYYIGNTVYENEIDLQVLKRNDRVVFISFGPRVIRKLINSKNPVSIDNLGRRFFSHFDLEWGPGTGSWHYDFGLRGGAMETPEGEVIGFDPRKGGEIRWQYVKTPPELEP